MTREEQKAITDFVQRAVAEGQMPVDVEADAIIRALFVRNPEAAYRITMMAMKLEKTSAAPAPAPAPPTTRHRRWINTLFEKQST